MKTFDPTKPVQTREGRPARILTTEGEGTYPIFATIVNSRGTKLTTSFTVDGLRYADEIDELDLVNIPEPETVYFNVSPEHIVFRYDTAAEADNARSYRNIALKAQVIDGKPVISLR